MVKIPLKQLVLNPSRGLSTIVIGSAANSVYFTFGQFPILMLMPNFFHLNCCHPIVYRLGGVYTLPILNFGGGAPEPYFSAIISRMSILAIELAILVHEFRLEFE